MTEWADLGQDALYGAQSALGLSNERVARELHMSVKTWERWKKRGQVPKWRLEDVASVLRLEVERAPYHVSVPAEPAEQSELAETLRRELLSLRADHRAALEEMQARFDSAVGGQFERQANLLEQIVESQERLAAHLETLAAIPPADRRAQQR